MGGFVHIYYFTWAPTTRLWERLDYPHITDGKIKAPRSKAVQLVWGGAGMWISVWLLHSLFLTFPAPLLPSVSVSTGLPTARLRAQAARWSSCYHVRPSSISPLNFVSLLAVLVTPLAPPFTTHPISMSLPHDTPSRQLWALPLFLQLNHPSRVTSVHVSSPSKLCRFWSDWCIAILPINKAWHQGNTQECLQERRIIKYMGEVNKCMRKGWVNKLMDWFEN